MQFIASRGCDRALIRCCLRLHRHRCHTRLRLSTVAMSSLQAQSKPKVMVVTGPTAVGKTAISLALAERLNGEIISADSVQVYKGLDIGSDKISVTERRGIPHHLLDVFEPHTDFSAGEFYHLARAATEDILSRGRTPIVVGGTGFYLRWFTQGKPSTPASTKESEAAADARISEAYSAAEEEVGRKLTPEERWSAGIKLIADLGDTDSADRLSTESNNYYRLQRVVNILLQSPGSTLAELKAAEGGCLDYDFRCYFLSRPRVELYRRIDARVEDMVEGGVIGETARELLAKGLEPNTNCATRAIGYRQTSEFLVNARKESNGNSSGNGVVTENSIIQLTKDIQSASRKLCHKQISWFRDDALFQWVDASSSDPTSVVDKIVKYWEEEEPHQGGCDIEFGGGRLSKEEQDQMKRYIAKLEKIVPKSEAVKRAILETEAALALVPLVVHDSNDDDNGEEEELEPALKRSKP